MLTQCHSLVIEFLIKAFKMLLVLSRLSSPNSGDAMIKFSYVIGCHLSSVHKASKSSRHEAKAAEGRVLKVKSIDVCDRRTHCGL